MRLLLSLGYFVLFPKLLGANLYSQRRQYVLMKDINVDRTVSFQNAHGVDAKKIYDTPETQVIHMALSPGQALKRHTTPIDVFFYILEGKGMVEIGEETQEVEKDMVIDSPKGISHMLQNTGESMFRFLVVKLLRTA